MTHKTLPRTVTIGTDDVPVVMLLIDAKQYPKNEQRTQTSSNAVVESGQRVVDAASADLEPAETTFAVFTVKPFFGWNTV